MKIIYQITKTDVKRVKTFYAKWEKDPFVARRYQRNVSGQPSPVTKEAVWRTIFSCLLSSQQRSGPKSAVQRFINQTPFPLPLTKCRGNLGNPAYIGDRIKAFGGIRRGETIGKHADFNLQWLEGEGWPDLLSLLEHLRQQTDKKIERQTADFVAKRLKGFGPKQSRNFLQALGLTRYETPIDSRITKWLNEFGFPVKLTAEALSIPAYYEFVADGFQALCEQTDIYPCLMDAAIFASFDNGGWQADNIQW